MHAVDYGIHFQSKKKPCWRYIQQGNEGSINNLIRGYITTTQFYLTLPSVDIIQQNFTICNTYIDLILKKLYYFCHCSTSPAHFAVQKRMDTYISFTPAPFSPYPNIQASQVSLASQIQFYFLRQLLIGFCTHPLNP